MRQLVTLIGLAALLIMLAMPGVAGACPWCKEAPGATSGDEDGVANAAAYNKSIYFMVGVPYLTFGVAAFLIYRGMKKNEHFQGDSGGSDDEGQTPPVSGPTSS